MLPGVGTGPSAGHARSEASLILAVAFARENPQLGPADFSASGWRVASWEVVCGFLVLVCNEGYSSSLAAAHSVSLVCVVRLTWWVAFNLCWPSAGDRLPLNSGLRNRPLQPSKIITHDRDLERLVAEAG
jgi:hypothetical protein